MTVEQEKVFNEYLEKNLHLPIEQACSEAFLAATGVPAVVKVVMKEVVERTLEVGEGPLTTISDMILESDKLLLGPGEKWADRTVNFDRVSLSPGSLFLNIRQGDVLPGKPDHIVIHVQTQIPNVDCILWSRKVKRKPT